MCIFIAKLPSKRALPIYTHNRSIREKKILSSFLTFASAVGKISFSVYFVIITKLSVFSRTNFPFVSSTLYSIIIDAHFSFIVFFADL